MHTGSHKSTYGDDTALGCAGMSLCVGSGADADGHDRDRAFAVRSSAGRRWAALRGRLGGEAVPRACVV